MKEIVINVSSPPDGRTIIGRRGENDYCKVIFDVTEWLAEWPGGTVQALYWRPDKKMTILASGATTTIEWIPSRTDTAVAGVGLVEFRLMSGETLGKKAPIYVMIRNAPKESGEQPAEEDPDWVSETIQAVEDAKNDAEAAASSAEKVKDELYEFWQFSEPLSILDVIEKWNSY